jgi:hypothetical protein
VRAACLIRKDPHYRRQAFEAGLERAGYAVGEFGLPKKRDDLLVIWNRQGADEMRADEWEQCGGTVIVCENGYFGRDANGHQLYAMSMHGHNGSGWFHVGDTDRFSPLGIELKPWRDGDHPLICAQRGIGSARMASPTRWEIRTHERLRAMGVTNVAVRDHPGKVPPKTTLDQDLENVSVCVIWSSASGLRALQLGVPVTYCAPHWIGEEAATRGLDGIAKPMRDDAARRRAMHRAAWGQRTIAEIESGEPFVTMREFREQAKW